MSRFKPGDYFRPKDKLLPIYKVISITKSTKLLKARVIKSDSYWDPVGHEDFYKEDYFDKGYIHDKEMQAGVAFDNTLDDLLDE